MWEVALHLLQFLSGKHLHEVVDVQQDPIQVDAVDGLWEQADHLPQTLNTQNSRSEAARQFE